MKVVLFLSVLGFIGFIFYVRHLEYITTFHPDSDMSQTPQDKGLMFEDIYFVAEDGVKLNGWYIPSDVVKDKSHQKTILMMHGNGGNISHRLELLSVWHDLGHHVFIFDYRGYGHSEGRPSEKGIYQDAVAAYKYLIQEKNVRPESLIAYGVSLGGIVAVDLSRYHTVGKLVIESSFTSAADIAKYIFPWVPSWAIQIKLDAAKKIQHISIPKLVMHSKKDQVAPYDLGYKLYQLAKEPKIFKEINGEHTDAHIVDRMGYINVVQNFLDQE